jgi:hypothetical protein
MPRRQTPAAMSAPSFQDLQSTQDRARLVYSSTGAHTRREGLPPRWIRRCERWRILGTPCGRQTSQDGGRFRQYFQGTYSQSRAPSSLSFHSGFAGRSSAGNTCPTQTYCLCWEFQRPQTHVVSGLSPSGCPTEMWYGMQDPIQKQTGCDWCVCFAISPQIAFMHQ